MNQQPNNQTDPSIPQVPPELIPPGVSQPPTAAQPNLVQTVGSNAQQTTQQVKKLAGIALPPIIEKLWPLFLAVFAIFFGIIVFGFVQKLMEKPTPAPVTIIVTPTPSPTPVRILTSIASTSAFTTFDAAMATLSAKISSFEANDPSLQPPSLVLPLNFPN